MVDTFLFLLLESLFFCSDGASEAGNAESEDNSCLLLSYILQCLGKIFMYDKNVFLTKERFDCLLQPLIDQVQQYFN